MAVNLFKVAGTLLEYQGGMAASKNAKVAGQRNRAAKEVEATTLRQRAGEEIAVSQQRAIEEKRRAGLVASRVLAVARGGATDPTVINLLANISGEGAYRAAVRIYEGKEAARGLKNQANASAYEGELAEEAGNFQSYAYKNAAKASLLKGVGSMFDSYGGGGPG